MREGGEFWGEPRVWAEGLRGCGGSYILLLGRIRAVSASLRKIPRAIVGPTVLAAPR